MDYATDNITVYRFCEYGCRYCWAWRIPLFKSRIERGLYDPVEEAKKYLNKSGRIIVVSFTSDPYPPVEAVRQLTRKVLEILARSRNRVLVLTKNPRLALRDYDVFASGYDMWIGTTVITLDTYIARQLEPRAPSPIGRLKALKWMHDMQVKTWLSIEPIIPYVTYPEDIVEATKDFIDWYVLGAFNYSERIMLPKVNNHIPDDGKFTRQELAEWYGIHVKKAIELLESYGKKYYVKKELRRYLETCRIYMFAKENKMFEICWHRKRNGG